VGTKLAFTSVFKINATGQVLCETASPQHDECQVNYFAYDDTLSVFEPPVRNSGQNSRLLSCEAGIGDGQTLSKVESTGWTSPIQGSDFTRLSFHSFF
jgi:hypothetical protein